MRRPTRDELIRRSRLLFVDDDKTIDIPLIEDLRRVGFAVDHRLDVLPEDLHLFDKSLYDLVLLDFANVGRRIGTDEGLSILRHIKRVSPHTAVLAYTSKSLDSSKGDFYKLADGVLNKDALIEESTETIEEHLARVRSLDSMWKGFLFTLNVSPGSSQDAELQRIFVEAVTRSNREKAGELRAKVFAASGNAAKTAVGVLLEKILESGVAAWLATGG